ncbi:hypothetical protein niasHT_009293 [Heterodera trifolii]|uniref:C3H1-type domain-containing protein n=1 Tax=Heterodera trifolii TaxID=157864 RepID=A0ABD2MBT6_9BILA
MEVYVRNPEEWTAFDVQVESQPNLISGEFFHAEEMRRECYPKGEKWFLYTVDDAFQRVQQAGGNSTAKIIEEDRIGKLKEKRCSTEAGPSGTSVHDNELEPLEEEENDVAIDKELPMEIPLEFDDNEQMQPSADYLEGNEDEQMAGPSNEEGEENNQINISTNSDKKRQLMSEISSILCVPPMTADKCAEVLDRSGTNQSSRELIAGMLSLLQSPIPSNEKSETEHIREEEEERATERKETREDIQTDKNDFLNQSSEPEDSEDSNLVEPAGQVVKGRQKETQHQPSECLFMNGLNITQRRDSGTDELQMEEEEQREKEQKGREEEEEETDDDEIIVIEQSKSTEEEKTKSGREAAFEETQAMQGEKEEKQSEEKEKEVQIEEEEKEAEQIGEEMEEGQIEEEEREVQNEGGENEEDEDDEEEEEEEEVVEDVIPADLFDSEDDESDKPLSDDSESRQKRQPISVQFLVPTAVVPTFSGTAPPSPPAEPRPNIDKECRNSTPSKSAKPLQSDANIQTHSPKSSATSKTQISTPSQSASNQPVRPAVSKLSIIQKIRQQSPPQVLTPPASRKSSITALNTPSTSSRKPSDSVINQLNVSGTTRKQQKSSDVTEKTQKVGNKSGRERDCWWLNTKDKKREKKKRRKEKERKRQESVANALISQNVSSSSSIPPLTSVPPLSSVFCPSVSLPCQSVRSFPTEICSASKSPPCPPHPIPPPPSKMPDDVPPKPSEVYQIGTRFYFENSIQPITDVRLHPYVNDCKHLFTHGFCSYKTNCKFSHGAKQRTIGWMHAEHRAVMLERANRILAQPEVNQRLPLELSNSTSKSPTTEDNRVIMPPAEGSCRKNSRSPSTERSRLGNFRSRHNSASKSPMTRSRRGNSRSRRRNSRSRHNLSSKSPTARSRPKTARSRSTARSRCSNSRSRLSNYRSRCNSGLKSPTARSRRSSSRHGSPAQYSRHNSSNDQHGAPMAHSVRSRSLIR